MSKSFGRKNYDIISINCLKDTEPRYNPPIL